MGFRDAVEHHRKALGAYWKLTGAVVPAGRWHVPALPGQLVVSSWALGGWAEH